MAFESNDAFINTYVVPELLQNHEFYIIYLSLDDFPVVFFVSLKCKNFYFNLTLGSGLTDVQRLLDYSTFTMSHVYIH